MDTNHTNHTPEIIVTALEHVRSFHPEVTHFIINRDERWIFMDDNGNIPAFNIPALDFNLLEGAAAAAPSVPYIYCVEVGE